jgi:hypothetical protein
VVVTMTAELDALVTFLGLPAGATTATSTSTTQVQAVRAATGQE